MVARNGIHLAVHLIRSHFGDLVANVCECLLNRGSLSLQELARFVELDPGDDKRNVLLIKNCLLVLAQHNCIQAFSIAKPGPGGLMKPLTKYMALLGNIFHRLRFAKFLAIVKEDFRGEACSLQCESLLWGLLQHGRLTFKQLVQREASKQSEATRDDPRASFNKLVDKHYVERCPKPDPFIPDSTNETSTARRGSKSGEKIASVEQKAIIAAALSDSERFSGISDVRTSTVIDEKAAEHHPGAVVGNKRKHEVVETDNAEEAAITENEILWRANFEKFVQCLKKKACNKNIKSRLGIDAALVLDAMIDSNSPQNAREKNSVTASMDAILERARTPEGNTMTVDQIRPILEQLDCHLCTEESEACYTIDLQKIINSCQTDEIEALILKRYGKEAYRIYRFLVQKGQFVEMDKVADNTFIEKKETYLILYKLWKDEYLDMDAKKLTAAGGGNSTYFLWKVKKDVFELVLNDTCHAILNLYIRAAYTVEQDPEILTPSQLWPEVQKKEREALQKRWMILQSSMFKLVDALYLFYDV